MLVFLTLNDIEIEYTQQELSDIILSVVVGVAQLKSLVKWILNLMISNNGTAKNCAVIFYPCFNP